MRKLLIICIVAFVAACAAPVTKRHAVDAELMEREAETQRLIALQTYIERLKKLETVAYPILLRNAGFCGDRLAPAFGWSLSVLEQIPKEYQTAASKLLGVSSRPTIIYAVPNTPASTAGLKTGDQLLSVNGKSVPEGKNAIRKLSEVLKAEGGKVTLHVERPGVGELNASLNAPASCDYPVRLSHDQAINAYADGEAIYFTSGMVRFTENDQELAVIVGHELAHNIMGHIDKKTTNALGGLFVDILLAATLGVDTQGTFTKAAGNAYSQEFEVEADYVGLYLMARSGYKVEDSPFFWRRMATEHPESIKTNHAASHPPTPERFLALENAVKEINVKRQEGAALVPELAEGVRITSSNASGAMAAMGGNEEGHNNSGVILPAESDNENATTLHAVKSGETQNRGDYYDEARNLALQSGCSAKVRYVGGNSSGENRYKTTCQGIEKTMRCRSKGQCFF